MILNEYELEEVVEKVKVAFPHLTDWEWNNEKNSLYFGFAIWGKLILEPDNLMSKEYFITLETYENNWRGVLTIGLHSYLWSSADVGDAHLLSTDDCDTVDEAIKALKNQIYDLGKALSAINE
ncbi:hypothetical protein [Gloeothece verrucosa]|uniref:Uncharacterized protein n=1 Tax=Gloeothece verrucosa (strain PCC 7822) TaxID=497965 RepID=E0UMT1_GLOV7|nr:hypothetical protein [Gloeothece verrucosa]ADN18261.1 hypothetical protein Cyan7822_6484 [Gloeothece verrucosa PCC 7822]